MLKRTRTARRRQSGYSASATRLAVLLSPWRIPTCREYQSVEKVVSVPGAVCLPLRNAENRSEAGTGKLSRSARDKCPWHTFCLAWTSQRTAISVRAPSVWRGFAWVR